MIIGRHARIFRLIGLYLVLCLQNLMAADDLPSVLDLQRSYVEANGGLSNIQELSSLIASGQIEDLEGGSHEFKLFRKRPDKMRIQVTLPGAKQMTIFDGEQAFRVVSVRGAPDQIVEISASETSQISADSAMDGPFFQLRGRPEWLEVVAVVDVDGEPAYEIVVSESANSPYERLWVSQEHHQEVKLSRRIELEDGQTSLQEIYFSDFEKIRGIWLAKQIRYENDGQIVQVVAIERVRSNVGIFDSYFAKPENR